MTAEAVGFCPHRACLDVLLAQFTNRVKQQQTLLRTALRVGDLRKPSFFPLPLSRLGPAWPRWGGPREGTQWPPGQGTHRERRVQEPVRGGGGGQALSGRRAKGEAGGETPSDGSAARGQGGATARPLTSLPGSRGNGCGRRSYWPRNWEPRPREGDLRAWRQR